MELYETPIFTYYVTNKQRALKSITATQFITDQFKAVLHLERNRNQPTCIQSTYIVNNCKILKRAKAKQLKIHTC